MSDTKENKEAGLGDSAAVMVEEAGHIIGESSNQASTSPQLRDDDDMIIDNLAGLDSYLDQEMHLEVQPVTVEETSKNDENVSSDVKIGKSKLADDDENVKPKIDSEDIPHKNVQDTFHSVPVEAGVQILNTSECETSFDVKLEAKTLNQSNNSVENDDTVCQKSVGDGDTETTAAEVKPEACEIADGKTCDKELISSSHDNPNTPQPTSSDINEPVPSSHNDSTTPQPAPTDTRPEINNVLEVESKAGEEQAAEPADNGNSDSQNMFFLDADHYYDGNESGTEEDQVAFMKELENFFRERSMEFKPPKFYGEGLNCLK